MPVHNADVASLFEEVADLLDLQEANRFRIRAYRNAARTLRDLSKPVAQMIADGDDLADLHGIGDDLAGKIRTIVETGALPLLDDLKGQTAPELTDLMHIPGLGPKRVRRLHDALGVVTRNDLKAAAQAGRIREVDGFGEVMEQKILDRLEQPTDERRWLLADVEPIAQSLIDCLTSFDAETVVDVAGSYRRRKDTVGDLDVLALSDDGPGMVDHFVDYEDVDTVIEQGDTRASVTLKSGLQVDLRVVPTESYGAALLYFTGSKAHNIAVRNRAIDAGMKLNEYGVFTTNEDERRIAGATEEEMYALFDWPWIPPELREDRGELQAASDDALPDLIPYDALRGNLHTHTTDSDGRASIRAMAEAAVERGLDYLAITDHSPAVRIAQGLDADALRTQMDTIDRLNDDLDALRLLKGIEVDILKDGSLDLPDDVLADVDVCLGAVHSHLDLPEDEQTDRLVRALEHPALHILAHPTGRRIRDRPPMNLNWDRLLEAVAECGCALELNAQPERLDLNDVLAKRACEHGIPLVIGADAHSPNDLDGLRYGIDTARRAWLTAEDVLNTKPWPDIKAHFDR